MKIYGAERFLRRIKLDPIGGTDKPHFFIRAREAFAPTTPSSQTKPATAAAPKPARKPGPWSIFGLGMVECWAPKRDGSAAPGTPPAREADSASSFPGVLRAGVKREAARFRMHPLRTFREADAVQAETGELPSVFRVRLIREGLGNLGDAAYYPASTLRKFAPVMEGQPCYANHPSKSEEEERPERDVRDMVGHFRNVQPVLDGDATELLADFHVIPTQSYVWVRELVVEAIKYAEAYPDKDLAALSINAAGTSAEVMIDDLINSDEVPESAKEKLRMARDEGVVTVRVATELDQANSCDLVTRAGAGGRFISPLN